MGRWIAGLRTRWRLLHRTLMLPAIIINWSQRFLHDWTLRFTFLPAFILIAAANSSDNSLIVFCSDVILFNWRYTCDMRVKRELGAKRNLWLVRKRDNNENSVTMQLKLELLAYSQMVIPNKSHNFKEMRKKIIGLATIYIHKVIHLILEWMSMHYCFIVFYC